MLPRMLVAFALLFVQADASGSIRCFDDVSPRDEGGCDDQLLNQPPLSTQSCAELLLRSDLWARLCSG